MPADWPVRQLVMAMIAATATIWQVSRLRSSIDGGGVPDVGPAGRAGLDLRSASGFLTADAAGDWAMAMSLLQHKLDKYKAFVEVLDSRAGYGEGRRLLLIMGRPGTMEWGVERGEAGGAGASSALAPATPLRIPTVLLSIHEQEVSAGLEYMQPARPAPFTKSSRRSAMQASAAASAAATPPGAPTATSSSSSSSPDDAPADNGGADIIDNGDGEEEGDGDDGEQDGPEEESATLADVASSPASPSSPESQRAGDPLPVRPGDADPNTPPKRRTQSKSGGGPGSKRYPPGTQARPGGKYGRGPGKGSAGAGANNGRPAAGQQSVYEQRAAAARRGLMGMIAHALGFDGGGEGGSSLDPRRSPPTRGKAGRAFGAPQRGPGIVGRQSGQFQPVLVLRVHAHMENVTCTRGEAARAGRESLPKCPAPSQVLAPGAWRAASPEDSDGLIDELYAVLADIFRLRLAVIRGPDNGVVTFPLPAPPRAPPTPLGAQRATEPATDPAAQPDGEGSVEGPAGEAGQQGVATATKGGEL
jgi:hypothetical protein